MPRNVLRGLVLAAAFSLAAPAAFAKIPAALLPKLAKGGPVKFVALTLKDFAQKGKPAPKATDKVTVNGKKVTYAEFLKAINSVKKRLNNAGHKLRNGRAVIKGNVKVDNKPRGRKARILAMHKKGNAFQRVKVDDRIRRFFERTKAIRDAKFAATVAKKYPNMFKFLKHGKSPVKK